MAASRMDRLRGGDNACSSTQRQRRHIQSAAVALVLAAVAASIPAAAAIKWEPGHLLTNFVNSDGSDFIRVRTPCRWHASSAGAAPMYVADSTPLCAVYC